MDVLSRSATRQVLYLAASALGGHSRTRKLAGASAAAAVVVALAAGCGSSGSASGSSGPITICEIVATSGPFAQLGTNDKLGATAWADHVNKAGGILGHQVKLVPENDASDPATAAALVRKCVTQVHANFIFGPEETATVAAGVPIANNLHQVMLSMGSGWAGQGFSGANLHSDAFPAVGNVFFADDLATITQLMQGNASKYGYSVVASQITNPGATDDTPQVLNLLKAKPDIIVPSPTP